MPRGQRLAALRDGRRGGHGGGPFGSLRCDAVIHAVGPNYHSLPDGEGDELERGDALLRSAYVNSMARAKEEQCKTVAFSLLSAGIFRGRQSLDTILAISVGAVADGAYEGLERVHLVAFTPAEQRKLKAAAAARFAAPRPRRRGRPWPSPRRCSPRRHGVPGDGVVSSRRLSSTGLATSFLRSKQAQSQHQKRKFQGPPSGAGILARSRGRARGRLWAVEPVPGACRSCFGGSIGFRGGACVSNVQKLSF